MWCDMRTHVTHPVHSVRRVLQHGIQVPYTFSLLSEILLRYKNCCEEDSIIIAQSEIAYLDDINLEDDIPEDVSDIADDP
jgi:hypothetical protein